ncbi:MAG: DUF1361 domain-containing protein [Gelidibacter sp.]
METLKTLIISRFKILSLLTVSMALSIILLMIRMKLNQSFFFSFLVWNLFLAVIPYAITTYLSTMEKPSKWSLLICFCAWLLFLPNAPYIITDLLHLRMSNQHLMWLDVLVVTSFAYNGLMLFFLSLLDMETILKSFTNDKKRFYLTTCILFLTGFGIYLGRFLRYNSWEILQNPLALFTDIFDIVVHPTLHLQAWVFTLSFGAFLSVGYWMFKTFGKNA